jgi:hypothetical protein
LGRKIHKRECRPAIEDTFSAGLADWAKQGS